MCDLSSKVKHTTVNDLLRANKVLKKAKSECVTLCFGDFEKLEKYKIVAYNDSSFGNLADGGSQGGFVIYLVNECGQASPIMWQSQRLQRIVKSVMAAETLIQVDCADACYWIGSLMNEIIHADHTKQAIPVIQCNTDSHQLMMLFILFA